MRVRGWIAVILVAAMGLAGVWWWRSRAHDDGPKYRTAALGRGAIEALVSATGTLRPVVQVEVSSQVSGTVAKLLADYNDRVREGQVLCQLEPSAYRARAAMAAAAVARAEAALKDSRRQLARARELIAQAYVSQADVDAAEVAVEQRDAELKQARAQQQAAAVDLANTTIHAPIDGIVIARSVDVGQTVAASLQAPKLFVIANDLAQMQVETRIDEADIGVVKPGLPVRYTVDAFPDAMFEGRVSQVRLEPIVEQGVVTYTTVIRTSNPELKLKPGMTANVSVLVARRDDVLKAPNAALRFRPPQTGREHGATASGGRSDAAAGGALAATPVPGASGANASAKRREQEGATKGGSGGGARHGGRDAGPHDSSDASRMRRNENAMARGEAEPETGALGARPALKPGTLYLLRGGKPMQISVMTGLTDGAFTEIESDEIRPGDEVVVGLDVTVRGQNLQPPPGMGGGGFGGGGGGRRGGGR